MDERWAAGEVKSVQSSRNGVTDGRAHRTSLPGPRRALGIARPRLLEFRALVEPEIVVVFSLSQKSPLLCVMISGNMTHMKKTQVYLPEEDLRALQQLAHSKKRRIADLVREAVRTVWLHSEPRGPVAICDGRLRGSSAEHDSAFDEP